MRRIKSVLCLMIAVILLIGAFGECKVEAASEIHSGFGTEKFTNSEWVNKTYKVEKHVDKKTGKVDKKKVDVTVTIEWKKEPKYKLVDYVELALDNVIIDKSFKISVVQRCTDKFSVILESWEIPNSPAPQEAWHRTKKFVYKEGAYSERCFQLNADQFVVNDNNKSIYISMPLRSDEYYHLWRGENGVPREGKNKEERKDSTIDDYTFYSNFFQQMYGYNRFQNCGMESVYTKNKITIKFVAKRDKNNKNEKKLSVKTVVRHCWTTTKKDIKKIINNIGTVVDVFVSVVETKSATPLLGLTSWDADEDPVETKTSTPGYSDWVSFKNIGLW